MTIKPHTLLDLRIAHDIDGVPGGQIQLVRNLNAPQDYAIIVDGSYLGNLNSEQEDISSDRNAVIAGLWRMRQLIEHLTDPETEE